MRCQKAQEFFSDYIEQTLERPMAIALEAHLRDCGACAGDVGGLRETWAALEAVPTVEPPAGFAERLAARVHQERAQRQAEHPWRLAFWQNRLRTLSPVPAMGLAAAAVAIVVGLVYPLRPRQDEVRWDLMNRPGSQLPSGSPQLPPAAADPASVPQVSLGPTRFEDGRWIAMVVVTPREDLTRCSVSATPLDLMGDQLRGSERTVLGEGPMRAGQPYTLPVPLGGDALGARAVLLRMTSPALPEDHPNKVLFFPSADRASVSGPRSLEMRDAEVYVALARLSAATRVPIAADTGLGGRVTVRLQVASPEQALQATLTPLGYRCQPTSGGYAVTRP